MDTLLLLLAFSLQTGDAVITCRALHAGTARELNPIVGQSCARGVALKAGVMTGIVLLPQKPRRIGLGLMAGAGAIAVTWNLTGGK